MTNECMVGTSLKSPSHFKTTSDSFGGFQIYTNRIGSKLLKNMSYGGQDIGKHGQGMKNSTEVKAWPQHEGIIYLDSVVEIKDFSPT